MFTDVKIAKAKEFCVAEPSDSVDVAGVPDGGLVGRYATSDSTLALCRGDY